MMNPKTPLIIIAFAVIGGVLAYGYASGMFWSPDGAPSGTRCPQDAKVCPDGSSVGRVGPNCEFAQCPGPAPSAGSYITGRVTLSPICPVEAVPPEPACAPKPYKTTIEIRRSGTMAIVATTQSNDKGEFATAISAGTYDVSAIGGTPLPTCPKKTVTVSANATVSVDLSCDTGIR